MVDLTAQVYAMLMRMSNIEKLALSGLPDIVIDDLWFRCVECSNQFHSDEMALVGVMSGTAVAAQSVGSFFSLGDGDISGLQDDLQGLDGIALRCVSCSNKLWGLKLEVVQGETPEGWRLQ